MKDIGCRKKIEAGSNGTAWVLISLISTTPSIIFAGATTSGIALKGPERERAAGDAAGDADECDGGRGQVLELGSSERMLMSGFCVATLACKWPLSSNQISDF